MLSYPWIMFDGLIAHIQAQSVLGSLWNQLPLREPLEIINEIPLPIKKAEFNETDFFYYASCSQFQTKYIYTTILHKHIAINNFKELERPKKRYDTVRGDFKSYAMEMVCNPSKWIDFYVNGDEEALSELCAKVDGLGKKRAIGFGRIMRFEISVCKEDLSLGIPDFLMRPIPIDYFTKPLNLAQGMVAYRPPYWAKHNYRRCYLPGGFV